MKVKYLETISLIERLHRQCLEVVKAELDRAGVRDLNNVQALILFNVGDAELSVGELTQRGYYLGSNVSYNVKKMVEMDYLVQERSQHDRRSFHVRASEKGLRISRLLDELFARHGKDLGTSQLAERDIEACNTILRRLQSFWSAPQHYSSRVNPAA